MTGRTVEEGTVTGRAVVGVSAASVVGLTVCSLLLTLLVAAFCGGTDKGGRIVELGLLAVELLGINVGSSLIDEMALKPFAPEISKLPYSSHYLVKLQKIATECKKSKSNPIPYSYSSANTSSNLKNINPLPQSLPKLNL